MLWGHQSSILWYIKNWQITPGSETTGKELVPPSIGYPDLGQAGLIVSGPSSKWDGYCR